MIKSQPVEAESCAQDTCPTNSGPTGHWDTLAALGLLCSHGLEKAPSGMYLASTKLGQDTADP